MKLINFNGDLKMNNISNHRNYKWFIGIDVSKNELDFAVLRNGELLFHTEIANTELGIKTFVEFLKKEISSFRVANAFFCMEQTGVYTLKLAKILHKLKASFAIENALRIKRSSGFVRGKGDREDSILIAQYASKHYKQIKLWQPMRPVLAELKLLMALRSRLVTTSVALKNPIKEQEHFVNPDMHRKLKLLCCNSALAIDIDKLAVDAFIDRLINSDDRIARLFQIITSIRSIGKVTAIHIILSTNEFLDINCPKKFACYSGVAPFPKESGGIKKKTRISQLGNRNMKTLLHMCAIGATLHNPELKQYYERKTQVEGKAKMAVLNALRYKLILRIFSCVQQDRLFTNNYTRSIQSNLAGESKNDNT
jgi:transposase